MKAPPFVYQPPATDRLPILYQDDAVIVVEKPAGLLSVPGRLEEHKDSLSLRLESKYPDVLIVHRLDMATSGLMVFARGREAHRALSKQFEARQVHKRYLAKVWGVPPNEDGEVDLPLITDWPNRPRQMVSHDLGKPSKTLWRVVTRDEQSSLLELTPVTGRSHQLRVHMAEAGHPILGDHFYGNGDSDGMASRLCLHASALGFAHPVSGEMMLFTSDAEFQ